ncbi:MAG: malate:quinone oxidoreductase, partial [Chitinophagaceae bacterium]
MKSFPTTDVVLIGAGIMTATLALMLKELEPSIQIHIFERLPEVAGESSDGWNNAGTGHSAFCELNYTTEKADGSIDISKAIKIASQFEESKQFWAWLTQKGYVGNPKNFIRNIPHMSFVWGENNVAFLQKRHSALTQQPLFKAMQFSSDVSQLQSWMPLVMEGRSGKERVAATRME